MFREPKFEQAEQPGHDLLELAPEEKQKLKERVEKWNGLIRMFVHPMYEKWRGNEEQYANDPKEVKLVQIEQILAKLLAMPEEKTPPIIIMEETAYIAKLQKWLKENPAGQSQNGVFFVKTFPNNPTPRLAGEKRETASQLTDEEKKEAWEKLINILDECGVKELLMGGMQMEVRPRETDWTEKGPFVSRCVGIALSYLSKDKAGKFKVELSALTEPSRGRNRYNYLKQKS